MEIELSRLFVKVIQQGSFSKAAQQLQIPKSTLSKAVTKLEKETGTKLLLRTTRSLTLTAAGRAFYETCLGPVQVLEEAQRSLHGADDILSGVIRLTAPDDFGNFVLAKALTELLKKHPNLRFELKYTNETLDLVKEGIDLAIRVGKLKESSLKAKRIGENKLIFVASPAYLKSRNPIRAPKDLTEHECMTINAVAKEWNLQSKKGSVRVPIRPRVICNQMSSLVSSAVAGAGIAMAPTFVCKPELESGKLIRVLPEWSSSGWTVSLVSPMSSNSSARLKVTMDHLFGVIQEAIQA